MIMLRIRAAAIAVAGVLFLLGALAPPQDYEVDGVKVTLLSLKRIPGDKVELRWEYSNTTSAPKTLGESFSGMGSSEAYSLTWGTYIADPVNNIKYDVIKQPNGEPVAGSHAGRKRFVLGGHKTYSTWAQIVAPPASVKSVNVYIPGVEPFNSVTIAGQ